VLLLESEEEELDEVFLFFFIALSFPPLDGATIGLVVSL